MSNNVFVFDVVAYFSYHPSGSFWCCVDRNKLIRSQWLLKSSHDSSEVILLPVLKLDGIGVDSKTEI